MRIVVLAFDRISPFRLAAPSLVFDPGRGADGASFTLQVCAVDPDAQGRIRTTAGDAIQPARGLEAAAIDPVRGQHLEAGKEQRPMGGGKAQLLRGPVDAARGEGFVEGPGSVRMRPTRIMQTN